MFGSEAIPCGDLDMQLIQPNIYENAMSGSLTMEKRWSLQAFGAK